MDSMNNMMNALARELTPITNWAIDQTDQHKRGLSTSLGRSVFPLLFSRVIVIATALTVAAVFAKASSPLLAIAAFIVMGYALVDMMKLTRKAGETAERYGLGDAGMLAFHASLGFNMGSSTLFNRIRNASWFPFA